MKPLKLSFLHSFQANYLPKGSGEKQVLIKKQYFVILTPRRLVNINDIRFVAFCTIFNKVAKSNLICFKNLIYLTIPKVTYKFLIKIKATKTTQELRYKKSQDCQCPIIRCTILHTSLYHLHINLREVTRKVLRYCRLTSE